MPGSNIYIIYVTQKYELRTPILKTNSVILEQQSDLMAVLVVTWLH